MLRLDRAVLGAGLLTAAVAATPAGTHAARTPRTSVAPACFGAAARDVVRPCDNPALHFQASPAPHLAPLQPNSPCTVTYSRGTRSFCTSGTPKASATSSVALLGDSHAPSWRAAVEVVARAERWRLLTLSRSSCPFVLARRTEPTPAKVACSAWVAAALGRLRHHPEIETVIVANSAKYRWATTDGDDRHAVGVAAYRAAFDALPATVRHIVVLRDNPEARVDTHDCVARAVARHQRTDRRCALDRSTALHRDAAADAARLLAPSGRTDVIDLTPFFCDRDRCPPVIGGALVYKDANHLTRTWATSLGPYVLTAYRALRPGPTTCGRGPAGATTCGA